MSAFIFFDHQGVGRTKSGAHPAAHDGSSTGINGGNVPQQRVTQTA